MLHAKGTIARARMAMLAACEFNSLALADERVAISENTRKFIPFINHVIPCGVDLRAFSPGSAKSAVPSVLFVGTMHGRKRGAMLLDLFRRQIKPAVPEAEFWAVCETRVEGDGVRWFGRIATSELIELYRSAWLFCLPSTYEGFGVPYIEAMACGAPVVASYNPGAMEVTRNGRYGLLAHDHKLAGAIVRVLADPALRQKMTDDGLARSRDFSWDRICAQYEAVYAGDVSPQPSPEQRERGKVIER
jgi:glycosyltransferase involved in cell wall biosynthesis